MLVFHPFLTHLVLNVKQVSSDYLRLMLAKNVYGCYPAVYIEGCCSCITIDICYPACILKDAVLV